MMSHLWKSSARRMRFLLKVINRIPKQIQLLFELYVSHQLGKTAFPKTCILWVLGSTIEFRDKFSPDSIFPHGISSEKPFPREVDFHQLLDHHRGFDPSGSPIRTAAHPHTNEKQVFESKVSIIVFSLTFDRVTDAHCKLVHRYFFHK